MCVFETTTCDASETQLEVLERAPSLDATFYYSVKSIKIKVLFVIVKIFKTKINIQLPQKF